MSLNESPKPRRPARRADFDPFTVQPVRPAPPPPTVLKPETSPRPAVELQISPVYISVLPEESSLKAPGTPPRPARPALRRPLTRGQHISQSTDTEYEEPSERRSGGISRPDVDGDLARASTVYETVINYEEPPERRNGGISRSDVDVNAARASTVYETVIHDYTTPLNPPPAVPRRQAPPRPLAPPRPAVRPRSPFQSITEEPTEPLYEFIPDTVLDSTVEVEEADSSERRNGGISRPGVDTDAASASPIYETVLHDGGVNRQTSVYTSERRTLPRRSVRSWSEHASVDGDNKAKELDILMQWWGHVEGWDKLPVSHQGDEAEMRLVRVVAHRVTMGMRLYQLLVFWHGRTILNHITELHCTADSLSRVGKNARIAGITGGTTGAIGAVAVVAGIALAPITFGASIVAAGIGVGVAAAGGVTGASAAITSKVKNNQVRSKVEKLLKSCKVLMEEILQCLSFVDAGMEQLRNRDPSKLRCLDACGAKTAQMALQEEAVHGLCSTDAISECSSILQGFSSGLDSYFSEDDKLRLKKGSENQFAEKIRELADKLKEGMDEFVRIKNLFHSVTDV